MHTSSVVLKYKTDMDNKEVIKLYIFTMVTFNTYYDPSPKSWEAVENIISYFWKFLNWHKGWITGTVFSLIPYVPILSGTPGLP